VASEPAGPLEALASLLHRAGPLSLSGLAGWFSRGEEYRAFVALTRRFLPQHEAEILAEVGVQARIAAFTRHFGDRYFPLPEAFKDGWVEEYEQLTTCIPIPTMGISWDDYHMLTEWRPSYQLLFALAEDPYESSGEGRIAFLESCAAIVPRELLERLGDGYSPEELHARLDGTRFAPAALAADWLHHSTNCGILDYTDEDNVEEEWDPETVTTITEHWARARDIQDRIHSLAEWLEVEPPARFTELLNFIEGREPIVAPSMTLEEWALKKEKEG